MTVYELIQRLAQYSPDQQVRFHFDTEIYGAPEHFDEDVECYDIRDDGYYPSNVLIELNF